MNFIKFFLAIKVYFNIQKKLKMPIKILVKYFSKGAFIMVTEEQIKAAKKDLINFKKKHIDFFNKMISLLNRYQDNEYKKGRTSYTYKDLFRIIRNMEREGKYTDEHIYENMVYDVRNLENEFRNDLECFNALLNDHIRNYHSAGYTKMAQIMYSIIYTTDILTPEEIKEIEKLQEKPYTKQIKNDVKEETNCINDMTSIIINTFDEEKLKIIYANYPEEVLEKILLEKRRRNTTKG